MWLQTEAFADAPLKRMAEFAEPFIKAGASWRVLGPNGSDGLKAMIDEAGAPGFEGGPIHSAIRFYSLYATVPDAVLLESRKDEQERKGGISKFLEDRHVALTRAYKGAGLSPIWGSRKWSGGQSGLSC